MHEGGLVVILIIHLKQLYNCIAFNCLFFIINKPANSHVKIPLHEVMGCFEHGIDNVCTVNSSTLGHMVFHR